MAWQQLSVSVADSDTEAAEAAMLEAGAVSVTFQDAGDRPVLEPGPGETPLWPETVVVGLFPPEADMDAAQAALRQALGDAAAADLMVETVPERDWERIWMDNFEPMRFGHRVWICPSSEAAPDPEAVNIVLDPGLAFGTGTHPTTALCLEWLDAHPPRDQLVIDYGCGSGILSVAALKLGARHVWAVDVDPQALQATEENAERNGIAAGDLYAVEPEGLPPIQANLIVANILARTLTELAPTLAERVRTGGHIVLAGILADQSDDVARVYAPWFRLDDPVISAGWALLSGRREP